MNTRTNISHGYVYNKDHYEKLKRLLNEVQLGGKPDQDIHLNWVMNTIGHLEHNGPLTKKEMRFANDLWNHYTKGKPAPHGGETFDY